MTRAIINFIKLKQDFPEYGSNEQYMVSRVFFDLNVDGKSYTNLYSNIKQKIGSNFESEPLDISAPVGYDGKLNFEVFRAIVDTYIRSLIVNGEKCFNKVVAPSHIRMYGNTFESQLKVPFDFDKN